MQRVSLIISASIVILNFSSCVEYNTQNLPSGKEIKIIGIGKVHFTDDDPALMLKYQTAIDIDSTTLLRKEVQEIWPVFRTMVENSGLSKAVINASQVIKINMIFYKNISRNFLFTINQNGTWNFPDSWYKDYFSEMKLLSEKYLNALIDNKFTDAANVLKYPNYPTLEELNDDISAVSQSIQILSEEFGTIIKYNSNESIFPYYKIGLYGGSKEYWDKHPVFMKHIYDVEFSEKRTGYMIMNFSIIDDKLYLSIVEYAVPQFIPNSIEKIEHIYSRLTNIFQKD